MEKHKESYKDLVSGLIRQINANYILEIGLGTGLTSDVCLDYLSQKPKSWSQDIPGGLPVEKNGKYVVIDFAPRQEGLDVLSKYDKKFWELRVGDTTKDDGIFQNCHDNRMDVILVDGSHWWSHVISDVQKVIINGCAKSDTLFVFHDTDSSHVMYAINKCAEEFNIQYLNIPDANLAIGKFLHN